MMVLSENKIIAEPKEGVSKDEREDEQMEGSLSKEQTQSQTLQQPQVV